MPELTVAVAGASGFVGRALLPALTAAGHRVIGLSRRQRPSRGGVTWRKADLFSVLEVEQAVAGADVLVYLVHSMLPSAALTQGRFEDMDLILADNAARACAAAGVPRVIYLGGLIPDAERLSTHLASRLECEAALASHGAQVTTLRAGLVVGPGGSSTDILLRLVRRLPVMLTPSWTAQPTSPIALHDVVGCLVGCVDHPETAGQTYDVAGPDEMPYRAMMARTAQALGLDRKMYPVPLITPRLSTLWVSGVTQTPRALVGPLVQSLRHPMLPRDRRLQAMLGQTPQPFDEAIQVAAAHRPPEAGVARPPAQRDVRSVQRLPCPPGRDAVWVAEEYARWLPQFFTPFLVVERTGDVVRFRARGRAAPLLELTLSTARSTPDRALLYVTGGDLAEVDPTGERRGRLEFRTVLGGAHVLAAVHDFVPRLPWPVYTATQAPAHLFVMWAFKRHLAALPAVEALGHTA